jgi:multidrug efflux pump subunit AcrB
MVQELIEKISHFFAENKALSSLIFISVVLFGLVSFFAMPKQYNPEIIRPAFVVSFDYEGATTKETIDRVGYELVEKLQVVPGVDEVMTEVKPGASIFSTIIFEVGHDKTKAKSDLMAQLEGHKYLASGAVKNFNVQEINPETIPILQIVFSSEELTLSEVRESVLQLRQQLLAIPGVSELTIVGGEGRSVIVEINPDLLVANGVSLSEVEAVLGTAGAASKSGQLSGEQYIIDTTLSLRLSDAGEIGMLPIRPGLLVRDVANVYEGLSSERAYTLHSTRETASTEVVVLGVSKREGASAPEVSEALLSNLTEMLPTNLSYVVVSDDGAVAASEIGGLTSNLITSIFIIGIILFLFLSTRAALVVLITVPLTFLMVLGVGYLMGETINRITLFALILSLGLLVDASIVVVENIFAHLKEAHVHGRQVSKARVAAGAVREVGVGLVLSALTSVIVFLPMNYITGMMGPYMGPISFFVPVALIASLVIAIVLTPFLATYILKGEEKNNQVSAYFGRVMDGVTKFYLRVLRKIADDAKFRKLVLWGALGAFLFSLIFPMTGLVHFQMLPKADRDQIYLYVDAPVGTNKEATLLLVNEVTEVAFTHPHVTSIQSYVAGAPIVDFNGLFKGVSARTDNHEATLRLNLTKTTDRKESSTAITNELRELLSRELGHKSDYLRLMEEPPGPPVLATLVMKIVQSDDAVREKVTSDLLNVVYQIEGVVDTYTSLEASVESINYQVNRDLVAEAGVSTREVLGWYGLMGQSQIVGELTASQSGERVPVHLSLPYSARSNPASLESLPILTETGEVVVLGGLLEKQYTTLPQTSNLEGSLQLDYVTAEIENRSVVYVAIELIYKLVSGQVEGYEVADWNLFGLTLVTDDGETVELLWGGEWEMTLENFRDLGIAMMAALFLIYGVLVAQYRSFAAPGFILVTVPLGLVGILLGFFVLDVGFGIYLTATALIGFIALIGIVVNNAIIYLEYVEQALAEGTSYADALVAAGAARLRPILLTSLTTVLGSLTIASDPVWSGLAWAIVFGLSLSTVLTLVIYPALLLQFSQTASGEH